MYYHPFSLTSLSHIGDESFPLLQAHAREAINDVPFQIHARIYIFAETYCIAELKSLAETKLLKEIKNVGTVSSNRSIA